MTKIEFTKKNYNDRGINSFEEFKRIIFFVTKVTELTIYCALNLKHYLFKK